jgi:hypothetical protein
MTHSTLVELLQVVEPMLCGWQLQPLSLKLIGKLSLEGTEVFSVYCWCVQIFHELWMMASSNQSNTLGITESCTPSSGMKNNNVSLAE